MRGNGRKNGAGNAVIDRALNAGLAQAAASGRDAEAEVLLAPAEEKKVTELCDVFGLSARSVLNAALRYEMFSVFRVKPGALGENRSDAIDEARTFFGGLVDTGVTMRGLYQLAGLRANADWMVWMHADTVEALDRGSMDHTLSFALALVDAIDASLAEATGTAAASQTSV